MNQRQARLARIRERNFLKRYGKATYRYWQSQLEPTPVSADALEKAFKAVNDFWTSPTLDKVMMFNPKTGEGWWQWVDLGPAIAGETEKAPEGA